MLHDNHDHDVLQYFPHSEMLMTSSNFISGCINGPWELEDCRIRPGRQLQFLSSGRKVELLLRL